MHLLFVSANSANAYMDIEREHRTLQQLVESSGHALRALPAAEIEDVCDALRSTGKDQGYDVLHFSGHITAEEGLHLRGSGRRTDTLGGEALKKALRGSDIKLVVLNACNSGALATSIADVVPAVIGTNHAVRDVVARQFTRNFYSALIEESTVIEAFQIALKKGKQGNPAYMHAGEDVAIG